MGKNNNIIEINGQRYDIHTGFVVPSPGVKHDKVKPPVATSKIQVRVKPDIHDIVRRPAKHVQAHTPGRAHTLMRNAVKRPGPDLKQLKAYGPADIRVKQSLPALKVSKSAWSLNTRRLQRAARIAKSQQINHFSAATATEFTPLPAQLNTVARTSQAAIRNHVLRTPAVTTQDDKSTTTAKLLERALEQATSHQQQPPRTVRHKRAKLRNHVVAGGLVLFLLGGVAIQNLPNIRLQLASAKVGFSASLPDYQPAGFSLGKLNYGTGVVAAQFHSNSDERLYSLVQKRSSWDNPALRDIFVAPIDRNYRTVEAGGRSIYLYGQHNATWINDGIWYVIQANGSLGDRQLIELATSL